MNALGAPSAPAKPYRFGDVLRISCEGNYDADIVISRTAKRGPPGARSPADRMLGL